MITSIVAVSLDAGRMLPAATEVATPARRLE
jgi:hypothetical protein